jgi:hypothetical protein
VSGAVKLLCKADDKTIKVISGANHMVKSAKEGNCTEFLLGGVTLIRGVANTVGAGASIAAVITGGATLTSVAVTAATIGLVSNALLEATSAAKSWLLKGRKLDANSLAIQRIMNEGFAQDIQRLNLDVEATRHIQNLLTAQAVTSAVFALGFTALVGLSIGRVISPQGVLIGATASTVGKMIRYQVFNHFLKKSLEKVQTDKQDKAATVSEEEEEALRLRLTQNPRLARANTEVWRPQHQHHPTLTDPTDLTDLTDLSVPADPPSLQEVGGKFFIALAPSRFVRSGSVPLGSVFPKAPVSPAASDDDDVGSDFELSIGDHSGTLASPGSDSPGPIGSAATAEEPPGAPPLSQLHAVANAYQELDYPLSGN